MRQSFNLARFCILVCLSVFLSACGPGQLLGPTLTPTPTVTFTPTVTPTVTPTFTPAPTFTSTPVPSSTPTATPAPGFGAFQGKILDAKGRPLGNIIPDESMVVALVCLDESQFPAGAECFRSEDNEKGARVLAASICQPGETAPECRLHFGIGAAVVAADGSYLLAQVPAGVYALKFIYISDGTSQVITTPVLEPLTEGAVVIFDFQTTLSRR